LKIDDSRQEKNTSFFGPHFLDHPSSTPKPKRNVCPIVFCLVFFFPVLKPSLLLFLSWINSAGYGHWEPGAMAHLSFFLLLVFPSRSSERRHAHMGEKGLGLWVCGNRRSNNKLKPDWKRLLSFYLSRRFHHPFPLSTSEDTPVDDRFGFYLGGQRTRLCYFGACFLRRSRQSQHTHRDAHFLVLRFWF